MHYEEDPSYFPNLRKNQNNLSQKYSGKFHNMESNRKSKNLMKSPFSLSSFDDPNLLRNKKNLTKISKGIFEDNEYKNYLEKIYNNKPNLKTYSSENMKKILDKSYQSNIDTSNSKKYQEFKEEMKNNLNSNDKSSSKIEKIIRYEIRKKDSESVKTKTLINNRKNILFNENYGRDYSTNKRNDSGSYTNSMDNGIQEPNEILPKNFETQKNSENQLRKEYLKSNNPTKSLNSNDRLSNKLMLNEVDKSNIIMNDNNNREYEFQNYLDSSCKKKLLLAQKKQAELDVLNFNNYINRRFHSKFK